MNRLPIALLLLTSVLLMLQGCAGNPYRARHHEAIDRQQVVQEARSLLGTPYRYGGTSPGKGFDCSGLVYYVHQQLGVDVPRTSANQYRAALPVSRRALRPGDLVFFHTYGRKLVSHVGIYVGKGKFIHAPSSGKRVSTANLNDKYWRKHYTGAGRL